MRTAWQLPTLVLLIFFVISGCVSPLDTPPPPSVNGNRIGNSRSNDSRVSIVLESVQVNRLPYDILDGDSAQMQLIIFWNDGNLLDGYASYFGNTAVTAYVGSTFDNLDAGFVGFFPDQVGDEVYIWIIAVDNDESDMLVDVGAGALRDEFGEQVSGWVARRIAATGLKANVLSLITGALLDVAYSVIEQPDLIGQQAFLLMRNQWWNEGRYSLTTDDGALTINYRIDITAGSVLAQQPTPTNQPSVIPTQRIQASNSGGQSFLNGTIDTARLNLRYQPSTDSYIVYRVSQYDGVRVLGRNSAMDWVLIDAGIVGWVNADYIVVEGSISQLPVITSPSQYPSPRLPISYICPGANGPSFHIGDRFMVPYGDGPSGVFNEPGREPVLGHVPEGGGGQIHGGPVCAVAPENRYLTWYYVVTDNGLAGYMNESFAETPIKAIVPD